MMDFKPLIKTNECLYKQKVNNNELRDRDKLLIKYMKQVKDIFIVNYNETICTMYQTFAGNYYISTLTGIAEISITEATQLLAN